MTPLKRGPVKTRRFQLSSLPRSMLTSTMSEPLPPNPYSDNSVLQGAYDCCLYVQGLSDWGVLGLSDAAMLQTAPQVAGRTLGYALIAAPTDKARHCVAREVFRCGRDLEALAGLAHLYIYGFICVCEFNPLFLVCVRTPLTPPLVRNSYGPTPAETPPSSLFEATVTERGETPVPEGWTPIELRDKVSVHQAHMRLPFMYHPQSSCCEMRIAASSPVLSIWTSPGRRGTSRKGTCRGSLLLKQHTSSATPCLQASEA